MDQSSGNDFREYRRLILDGLERANSRLDRMDEKLAKLDKDLTALTVKMGIYGAFIGAVVGAFVSAFVAFLTP